jgi:hypothetical protein
LTDPSEFFWQSLIIRHETDSYSQACGGVDADADAAVADVLAPEEKSSSDTAAALEDAALTL